MNLLSNPSFIAYALACVVVCANLMFLWMASGLARAKTKTALNEEDARKFGAVLVTADPPAVARILRAHQNTQASAVPFMALGLVFVLAGGGATFASILFAVFVVARLLHTVAYLKGLQPWRSVFFVVGMACLAVLVIAIAWMALRAA